MTYAAVETAAQSGRPVELYEFLSGSTYYRYTSSDGDVTYGGNTYTAAPIARGTVEHTSETARLALNVTCDRSLSVLNLFATLPPDDIVYVTLRRLHSGDGEAIIMWIGRALNVTWNNDSAQIHCESVYTSLKRTGLRRLYQKACPHVIYGAGCNVDRDDFVATYAVATVAGTTLTLSSMAAADHYFSGGYLEWTDAGTTYRRAIRTQVGASVVISFPLTGLSSGDVIDMYPGCDHTLATCTSKFGNHLNYGGMPYFPDKNPFAGVAVY